MKMIKVKNRMAEVVEVAPSFDNIKKEIGCSLGELVQLGKYAIIVDEEGTYTQEYNLLFFGDYIITKSMDLETYEELTEEEIEDIKKGVRFLASLDMMRVLDEESMKRTVYFYSYDLAKKYLAQSHNIENFTPYDTLKLLLKEEHKHNYTFEERLMMFHMQQIMF